MEEKFLFSPPSSLPLSSFSHFVWVRGRKEKLFRASSSYFFCFLLAPLTCLLPFRKEALFPRGDLDSLRYRRLGRRGGGGNGFRLWEHGSARGKQMQNPCEREGINISQESGNSLSYIHSGFCIGCLRRKNERYVGCRKKLHRQNGLITQRKSSSWSTSFKRSRGCLSASCPPKNGVWSFSKQSKSCYEEEKE